MSTLTRLRKVLLGRSQPQSAACRSRVAVRRPLPQGWCSRSTTWASIRILWEGPS